MTDGAPIGGMQRAGFVEPIRERLPDGAVSAAKSVITTYGRATADLRPLPDFLVIGTKKGGTTSLMNWLVEHPNVMRMFPRYQRRKSPHYFDINYAKGEGWYRAHFPSRVARKTRAVRTGEPVLVGEASPYYMFHPMAAERMHATVPRVRLIAVLREPVSRAYSNYWDRVATGHEDLATFEEAIEAEGTRLSALTPEAMRAPGFYSYDHDHHTYLARGRYSEQLRRFIELFGRDQLLVLPADSMFHEAQATFDQVQDFLHLPRAAVPLLRRNERSGYPPMQPETRARLESYYAPYNAELADLLGTDFGW